MKLRILIIIFHLFAGLSLAQPANNNCGGAISLPVNANCVPFAGSSNGATQSQSGCNGNADDDVWYSFVANSSDLEVTVIGAAGFTPVVQVFSGTCGGSSLACNVGTGPGTSATATLSNLFSGVTYWIRVYHAGAGGGNFEVCVHEPKVEPGCNPNNAAPANQMSCDQVPKICEVNGFCGQTSGSYTVDHWPELNTAFCGGIDNNSFIKFTANAAQVQLRIWMTCSSGTGVQFMIFSLNTPVGSPGFTCNSGPVTTHKCEYLPQSVTMPNGAPLTIPNLTPGQDYYLMFDGYAGSVCDYKIGADYGVQLALAVSPSNKSICLGNSVALTASGGDGNYTWNASTDLDTLAGPDVIATPTSLGNKEYIVTSTSTDPECPASIDTAFIEVVTTPSPNAGIPDSVCLGEPISLNGALSNTNNNAVWLTFNPGITNPTVNFLPNFSVPNPTVTTDKAGVYYFILRETSQLCGQYKDTVAVTVIKPEQILQGYNPSCYGQTDGEITVENQFADEYSYDNGATWVPDSNMVGFAAGTYTVCSRNYLGCDTCTQVTVPEGPQIGMDVSNDTIVCENGTASLRGYGSGGTTFYYHWEHTTDQAALQPVSPVGPRFYKVYVENEGGCLSNTDSIYVDILPPLEMTNSADTAVCPGETAYMFATAAAGNGGPYNFKWSHGPETNGTDDDMQSVSPPSTTTYTVTVSDNCETTPLSATFEIEISPLPEPAFLVEEDSICEPAVFKLYNNTDPLLSESTFWEISSGDTYTDLDSIVTPAFDYGSYDVTLTVLTPDGCVNTTKVPGFLKSMVKPHSAFRFNPNPVTMFNTKLNFSNYSLGAQHFEWYFPGGAPNYSEEESVAVQYPDGVVENYPVNFVAISDFGCRDTSMQVVEVLSEVILYVPNTFTPNDDLFNNTWKMSIAGIEIETFEVTVYNRWGQEVFHSLDIENAWDGRYNGEIVPDGLYTYIIEANDAISTENYQWTGNLNILK